MDDELLELVDENDKIIGEVWKSQAHNNSQLIHGEVAIALFNKKGEVLIQQRSMKKKVKPGEWKVSAAGHIGKGENPTVAIQRETKEELGLDVKPTYLYKYFREYKSESHFTWVYYAIVEKNQAIDVNKNEVEDTKWVSADKIDKFAQKYEYFPPSSSYKIIKRVYQKIAPKLARE